MQKPGVPKRLRSVTPGIWIASSRTVSAMVVSPEIHTRTAVCGPAIAGGHNRRRFLHDGRATTLESVLTRHHHPEKLAGEKLSADELRDLIANLKSL